jgi:hypothetical protein
MAKSLTEIESLARQYTAQAIETLAHIMRQPRSPESARVKAAEALLNRGWGSPKVAVESEVTQRLRYVIEAPAELSNEEWEKKYGTSETVQ